MIEHVILPTIPAAPHRSRTRSPTTSTRPGASSPAVRWATPASPGARSSSTPTAAPARTAAARSPARIRRRSTARRATWRATWPRTSSAAGLAERAQVQVAYAIGVAEPVSIMVETFGTGKVPERADGAARPAALRLHARGHHQVPEPAAPDLSQDRRVRTLRAQRAGLHLGAHWTESRISGTTRGSDRGSPSHSSTSPAGTEGRPA